MLISQNGLELYILKLSYKLRLYVTAENCTQFTHAFDVECIHADVTEAEVYAGQVEILQYTLQCFSANVASSECTLEVI